MVSNRYPMSHPYSSSNSFNYKVRNIKRRIETIVGFYVRIGRSNINRCYSVFGILLCLPMPITYTQFRTHVTIKSQHRTTSPSFALQIHLSRDVSRNRVVLHRIVPMVQPITQVNIIRSRISSSPINNGIRNNLTFLLLIMEAISLSR